jgi:hypothetical protein
VEIGDTFVLVNQKIDPHLWIVISLPQNNAEEIVIVNLTTHGVWKDQSCILDAGQHPWIRHKSCVSYRDAKCVPELQLDSLLASGVLVRDAPVTDDILRLLLMGAVLTNDLPNKFFTAQAP